MRYRLTILCLGMCCFCFLFPLASILGDSTGQRRLIQACCDVWLFALGVTTVVHGGPKPVLKETHLFVANHTIFVDWIVVSAQNYPHATIAQRPSGILGIFMKYVLSAHGSVMFERKERRDRTLIQERIRGHVQNVEKTPLLIFPEGTCVNNEYTVMFHKGAFELGAAVCPVAIKYVRCGLSLEFLVD